MRTSFDDLIQLTDGDGASVEGLVPGHQAEADGDLQDLLDAWSLERKRAVEAELVLEEVLDFLERTVRRNRFLPDPDRREARKLIRAVRLRLDERP